MAMRARIAELGSNMLYKKPASSGTMRVLCTNSIIEFVGVSTFALIVCEDSGSCLTDSSNCAWNGRFKHRIVEMVADHATSNCRELLFEQDCCHLPIFAGFDIQSVLHVRRFSTLSL